ncbi:MAG: DUF2721 domain-containing protein [Methylophilaceae bacterium]
MFTPITDIHLVSEAIRDAVAPVFLLTGIGSILNVMVGRLARAIDRARIVNVLAPEIRQKHKHELYVTVRRITWLRIAIGFATLAALLVCISIASLFISVESGFSMPHMVLLSFISSMGAIIVALLCFLREILLTSNEAIVSSHLE